MVQPADELVLAHKHDIYAHVYVCICISLWGVVGGHVCVRRILFFFLIIDFLLVKHIYYIITVVIYHSILFIYIMY